MPSTQTYDTKGELSRIKVPELPSVASLSGSLTLCEKIYNAQDGVLVIAGTFNRLTQHNVVINPQGGTHITIPAFGVHFRLQYIKEKVIQVLFILRVISTNGQNCSGATVIGRADYKLDDSNSFGSDGGFNATGYNLKTDPIFIPKPGQPNSIIFQVEAWAQNKIIAFHRAMMMLEFSSDAEVKP